MRKSLIAARCGLNPKINAGIFSRNVKLLTVKGFFKIVRYIELVAYLATILYLLFLILVTFARIKIGHKQTNQNKLLMKPVN